MPVDATTPVPVLRVTAEDLRKERNAAGYVWSGFIETNKDAFAERLGWPIGRRLGCGYYGCVFASEEPWVVKITRDPTEGPTWAFIGELFEDPELADTMGGFCRVNDVARLRPDVLWVEPSEDDGVEEQLMPVFAIMRESATPMFQTDGRETFITGRTARELDIVGVLPGSYEGQPAWTEVLDMLDVDLPGDVRDRILDLATVVISVNEYRQNAEQYYRLTRLRDRVVAAFEREEIVNQMEIVGRRILAATAAIAEREGRPNRFGAVLGATLRDAFADADTVIADLHNFNVGWREHATARDTRYPRTLVVTDPGVAITPWQPDVREVDLAEQVLERNGFDVQRHLGRAQKPTRVARRRARSGYRIA